MLAFSLLFPLSLVLSVQLLLLAMLLLVTLRVLRLNRPWLLLLALTALLLGLYCLPAASPLLACILVPLLLSTFLLAKAFRQVLITSFPSQYYQCQNTPTSN